MIYNYDRRTAAKLNRFPEGVMTEEEWVLTHAELVEPYEENWQNLYNRTKFNRMDNDQQREYEKELKLKAQKPHFRAWTKGRETFFDISRATYELAKRKGVPAH